MQPRLPMKPYVPTRHKPTLRIQWRSRPRGVDAGPSWDKQGRRRWVRLDEEDPIIVLSPAGWGKAALRLYRHRWGIESSVFHRWAIDKARPRPKRINAHVVQFLAHVLVKTLATLVFEIIQSLGPPETANWNRVTASYCARLMVEHAEGVG